MQQKAASNDISRPGLVRNSLSQAVTMSTPVRRISLLRQVRNLARSIWRFRWIYVLMIPSLVYFAIFRYGPLLNAQIAFKDFKPLLGVWGSSWNGLANFDSFIHSFYFNQFMFNTIFFSLAKLLLGVPAAIILAIAL